MKKFLILAALLVPVLAHADASSETKASLAKIDATMDACLDTFDGRTDYGMKACTGVAYQAADALLNRLYKNQVAQLKKKTGDADLDKANAEILNRLIVSERAWIRFRDADSNLSGVDALGGTLENLEYIDSEYTLTSARAQELANLFQAG